MVSMLVLAFLACLLAAGGDASNATRETEVKNDGLIVFWNESPWPAIWAIRPDGSHLRRILRNRQNAKRPRLSPDRKWVAFDGTPPGRRPLSDFDIQLIRLDGSGLTTLTSSPEWDVDAQWSPDGALLSFSRRPPHPIDERESFIWIIRRDGGEPRQIVRGFGARWSPDGKKLVYEAPTDRSRADLFVIDVEGGESRPLLSGPALKQPAAWSPDGRKILFTRFSDSSGRRAGVFVMNADSTSVRRLGPGFAAGWSPDGSKILYNSSFHSALFVMNADGSHKRRIGTVAGSEPDWR